MLPHIALLAALACPVPQDTRLDVRPPPLELSSETLQLEDIMAAITAEERDRVIAGLVSIAEARQAGRTEIIAGVPGYRQNFDLEEGGYCARLMRQGLEAFLPRHPQTLSFKGDDARHMARKLAGMAGLFGRVGPQDIKPGDILFKLSWLSAGRYGHVGMYIGDYYGDGRRLVVENTSSGKRGDPLAPGTKLTSLKDFGGISQAWRLGP